MEQKISISGFPRLGGIAAIGFATMIVLANVIAVPAGLPTTGAPVGEVDAFFGSQGGIVGISSALTPAAWLLATLFGGGADAASGGPSMHGMRRGHWSGSPAWYRRTPPSPQSSPSAWRLP